MKKLSLIFLALFASTSFSGGSSRFFPYPSLSDRTSRIATVLSISGQNNDCGFRSLGLVRRHAINFLIDLIQQNNTQIIQLIQSEFISEMQPETLPSNLDLINYLRTHYLSQQEMLYYHPDDRAPFGTLVALAHAYQIELVVYMEQNDPGTARRVLHYTPSNPQRTVYLLHTTGDLREPRARNHFNLLEFPHSGVLLSQNVRIRSELPEIVQLQREVLIPRHLLHRPHPNQTPKLTVVLDLDETLVSNRIMGRQAVLRNYLKTFSEELKKLTGLEIVLWTASVDFIAIQVVQQFDPHHHLFDAHIYRDSLWFEETNYTKDLSLLGRNLDRTLLIDNNPECCVLHPNNCLLVDDFLGQNDPTDLTLLSVLEVIGSIYQRIDHKTSVPQILLELSNKTDAYKMVAYFSKKDPQEKRFFKASKE